MSAIFRSVGRFPRHGYCSGSLVMKQQSCCHVSFLAATTTTTTTSSIGQQPLDPSSANRRPRQQRASCSVRFPNAQRSGYHPVRYFAGLSSSSSNEENEANDRFPFRSARLSFSTYTSKSRKRGIMSDLDESDSFDTSDWEVDEREFGADPDEEAIKKKAQERAELKKIFENKKGRGWSDAMDMRPIWEANLQLEDIPDWTPEGVSTISRERVRIHPDKIPTLSQLARLPLPMPVHPCPGDGKTKAYALYRQRALQQRIAVAVRARAKDRVAEIQALTSWEEKQKAVDLLFETIEEELRATEIILGRQPMFGEWVEKALESYLVEVDESSQNSVYQQVATAVRAVAAPAVKRIEELPTLEAKLAEAQKLFGSIGSRTKSGPLGEHPLFGHLQIRAMEDYLSESKDATEETLYRQVAQVVRNKVAESSSLDDLLSAKDQESAIIELAKSIHDGLLDRFDAKHYNFSKWLIKAHDDCMYQQIASAVRADDSLYSDMAEIDDPDAQKTLITYRAKVLKQQLEDVDFPLSKHERFVNWTKRALEELLDESQSKLYRQLEPKVVAKVSTEDAERIQALATGDEKWAALDNLTESLVRDLGTEDLAGHYQYERWVKKALKDHLQKAGVLPEGSDVFLGEKIFAPLPMVQRALEEMVDEKTRTEPYPTREDDEKAVPIFMDCYGPGCGEKLSENVPDILRPLKFANDRVSQQGKMLEEWELAAHKETKRIMLRESTRQIAQVVEQGATTSPRRIMVYGKQGAGKTAALAAIVASARKSGHIVYYMPDTRMLHEHGYFNVPNKKRPGIFDLPILCTEQCKILLETHRDDFAGIYADRETMGKFFSDKRMELTVDNMSVLEILELGAEKDSAGAAMFSCAVDALMNQDVKPFTMVMDEFNVLFTPGKYFNQEYDEKVNKPIPYNQINLFKPFLDAAGINIRDNGETYVQTPVMMKKGSIVFAFTEGHAVSPKVNNEIMTNARLSTTEPTCPLVITEIPRLTKLEVEHMLANYEAIGLGKLRLDGGETVTNPNEVEYLRMVSSANPQKLLNACIVP